MIRTAEGLVTMFLRGGVEPRAVYLGDERVWPGPETRLWVTGDDYDSNLCVGDSDGSRAYFVDFGDGCAARYTPQAFRTINHHYLRDGVCLTRIIPEDGMPYVFNFSVYGLPAVVNAMLHRAEIGRGVKEIRGYAFNGGKNGNNYNDLVLVTIPTSVYSVGDCACIDCKALAAAEIGARALGVRLFQRCPQLRRLWLRESVETVPANCLADIAPEGALTIYCEADEKPASWTEGWNPDNFPVVWGKKVRPW